MRICSMIKIARHDLFQNLIELILRLTRILTGLEEFLSRIHPDLGIAVLHILHAVIGVLHDAELAALGLVRLRQTSSPVGSRAIVVSLGRGGALIDCIIPKIKPLLLLGQEFSFERLNIKVLLLRIRRLLHLGEYGLAGVALARLNATVLMGSFARVVVLLRGRRV